MPAPYNGSVSSLAGGQSQVTITDPADGDANNAAAFTTAFNKLADYAQWLLERVVLLAIGSMRMLAFPAIQSTFGSGDHFRSIVYSASAGRWVGVTDNGLICYSVDGGNWLTATTPSFGSTHIRKVIFAEGLFVAVGGDGSTGPKIATSPDGDVWTQRTVPNSPLGTENIVDVAHDGSTFVAVAGDGGTNGNIYSSPDGITWTRRASIAGGAFQCVAFLNGLWLAGGLSGLLYTSTAPTSTWTARTAVSGSDAIIRFAWGASRYVYLAGNAGLRHSADGTTGWAAGTNALSSGNEVIFDKGIFVALGSGTARTSTDGITWTTRTPPSWGNHAVAGLLCTGNFFVAGDGVEGFIAFSRDGITWSTRALGSASGQECLCLGWSAERMQLVAGLADGGLAASPPIF